MEGWQPLCHLYMLTICLLLNKMQDSHNCAMGCIHKGACNVGLYSLEIQKYKGCLTSDNYSHFLAISYAFL